MTAGKTGCDIDVIAASFTHGGLFFRFIRFLLENRIKKAPIRMDRGLFVKNDVEIFY